MKRRNLSKRTDCNPMKTSCRAESTVKSPQPFDVLLGRGKSNRNHPGNKRYQGTKIVGFDDCDSSHETPNGPSHILFTRSCNHSIEFIHSNRQRYFRANLHDKRAITMEILSAVQSKGRFLVKEENEWKAVSDETARQKIAHSIQYRQRCLQKESPPAADDGIPNFDMENTSDVPESANICLKASKRRWSKESPMTAEDDTPNFDMENTTSDKSEAVDICLIASMFTRPHDFESSFGCHVVIAPRDTVPAADPVHRELHGNFPDTMIPTNFACTERIASGQYPSLDHQVTGTGSPSCATSKIYHQVLAMQQSNDVYDYSDYRCSATYEASDPLIDDRKLPAKDPLDYSGVHSLTSILSCQGQDPTDSSDDAAESLNQVFYHPDVIAITTSSMQQAPTDKVDLNFNALFASHQDHQPHHPKDESIPNALHSLLRVASDYSYDHSIKNWERRPPGDDADSDTAW
jgi:hypothetical protein